MTVGLYKVGPIKHETNMMLVKKIENSTDFLQAMQIRTTVFVDEQGVPASEEYDGYDNEATHFIAVHERIYAGTARWRMTSKGVKLERFAVLADHRRKGVGAALLDAVLGDVGRHQEAANKTIYIHAQSQAVPFWEKEGFAVEGQEFIEAEIPHFRMVYGSAGNQATNKYSELAVG